MGKIVAFFGILVVAGVFVAWKFLGESESMSGKPAADTSKGANGTDMKTSEKKVTTKASYTSPAGPEEIGIVVMVNSQGVVTDVVAEVLATHAVSKTRQLAFSQGIAEAVKGKKLSELSSIDRVGGSSLTTGAFNGALTDLKAQL